MSREETHCQRRWLQRERERDVRRQRAESRLEPEARCTSTRERPGTRGIMHAGGKTHRRPSPSLRPPMQSTLHLSNSHRIPRPEPPQPSTSRSTRPHDPPNGDRARSSAPKQQRSYRDKFNQLKEKFDQVNATRDRYNKELAVAQDKIKKLENECNLLLDAVDIAAPSQPSILHFLTQDPIPAHYHLISRGSLPPPMVPPEPEPQPPSPQVQPTRSNGTNGHHEYGGRVNASVW
ncbi:hypothetical protein BXZ70DRAFT_388370 [Cristinia sonorae]|uniref:Uncharacterized protein n=1 Tax=Cristinia sonorae TaxID=1940300 RepID=A0A8K0UIH0_9AGAR|nr:hypothetical protein BXZ70DRAFT_388370 [Cristinia sonorae]